MKKYWTRAQAGDVRRIFHVYPTSEESRHRLVGTRCDCAPQAEVLDDGDVFIFHNSQDGREWNEADNCRLN
jgi:hypothetical protein